MRLPVPYFHQEQRHTCGIACLRMAAHFFGGEETEGQLEALAEVSVVLGITCSAIARAAEKAGYDTLVELHDPDLSGNVIASRSRLESAWARSGFEGVIFRAKS